MAIIHDDPGRRRFLSQAVMGFGLLFGMGLLGLRFVQFLVPTGTTKRNVPVLLGVEQSLPLNDAITMELGNHKLLVLRTNEGVAAFSRRCTDLGCLVSWDKRREQFICPCHQGIYDKQGRNIAGPPPRPLDRYEVVNRAGQVYVNLAT
ncbi:cytochrome b6-F complex iron-sulfur subunit [Nitrospira sp.]|nr:cytochrome b6-F complex iron-sulfur subunit [Nitrospira sp.]